MFVMRYKRPVYTGNRLVLLVVDADGGGDLMAVKMVKYTAKG